jgi:hypothetical protein
MPPKNGHLGSKLLPLLLYMRPTASGTPWTTIIGRVLLSRLSGVYQRHALLLSNLLIPTTFRPEPVPPKTGPFQNPGGEPSPRVSYTLTGVG